MASSYSVSQTLTKLLFGLLGKFTRNWTVPKSRKSWFRLSQPEAWPLLAAKAEEKWIVGTIALELESQSPTRQLQTRGFEP